LDKAHKFTVEPLLRELMVRVYVHRVEGAEPFEEKRLLKLAQIQTVSPLYLAEPRSLREKADPQIPSGAGRFPRHLE